MSPSGIIWKGRGGENGRSFFIFEGDIGAENKAPQAILNIRGERGARYQFRKRAGRGEYTTVTIREKKKRLLVCCDFLEVKEYNSLTVGRDTRERRILLSIL